MSQENSFNCVKCGTCYSEESNAYEGFTCEDCLEEEEEEEELLK